MATEKLRIKVASASLNQTVYDFATNVPNILAAIDRAVVDGADILSLEELGLTGYAADDYHQWNKDNDAVWPLIKLIANYANDKNPDLVISLGTPWHYADKSKPANSAAYNINNRPFNCQFTITGGEVVAIAAKSILADGAAEYERRQFNDWPLSEGTITIPLPDGARVPFGKPIVVLGDGEQQITLTHEICAEGWPGVHDDLSIDAREQREARHIVQLSKSNDLTVVLNPSASKPQPKINKEAIRENGLCKSGSEYCDLFVYTNFLGSSSGTYAAEGSQIFAQGGEIIHHGQRYCFKDISYSSVVAEVKPARHFKADASAHHEFKNPVPGKTGVEAEFDAAGLDPEKLKYEEYMRSIALWLRDYMRKQSWPCQGYVISLSGGKDSAYGAIAITMMVDLEVKENGISGFFDHFPNLKYRDEVLEIERTQGLAAAARAIKDRILTCVYLPSENSSVRTQNAARFLIEGGTLPDGTKVEGIGGRFQISPVQGVIDEVTASYTGLNLTKISRECYAEILGTEQQALASVGIDVEDQILLARGKALKAVNDFVNAAPGSNPQMPPYLARYCRYLPTWADGKFDVTLQNTQARGRLPVPWAVANDEYKIALVTSNESEAVLGYTTAGGDMHMGGANPIGGMPKETITRSLLYFAENGLVGLPPTASLYFVNAEKPSAELRKESEGVQQTDESDLGFTYAQSDDMEHKFFVEKCSPAEVFAHLRRSPLFPDDVSELRLMVLNFARRWEAAQFKRVMGPLAPHVGNNVDPHQAVRTTVLGDHFKTGCAEMTLDILKEQSGGAEKFQDKYGVSFVEAQILARINPDMKSALIYWPLEKLQQPEMWRGFAAVNQSYRPQLRAVASSIEHSTLTCEA